MVRCGSHCERMVGSERTLARCDAGVLGLWRLEQSLCLHRWSAWALRRDNRELRMA